MINLSFQNKINDYFNSISLDRLPHSMIFEGNEGCGKHSLCHALAEEFKLNLIEITDNLNHEYLSNLMLSSQLYLCIIDSSSIDNKDENTILKFIEEPATNIFVCILVENCNRLLDTIINRCITFKFNPYAVSQLKSFADESFNEEWFCILDTPGLIKKYNSADGFENTYNYAQLIVDKIKNSNISNILNIPNKLSEEDNRKIDTKLLLRCITYICKNKLINCFNQYYYCFYVISDKYLSLFNNKNLNKNQLIDNYLMELKYLKCVVI